MVAKVAAPKKTAAAGAKKPVSAHPSYKEMITQSIVNLKERTGSSRQAIKKYIHANYKGLTGQTDNLINAALKKGVESGDFVQPKGASGPVKLARKEKPAGSAASPAVAKPKVMTKPKAAAAAKPKTAAKKAVKSSPKKAVVAKKAAAKPKKAAVAKKVAAAKPKTAAKTKTATKPKTAAKPKKAAAAAKPKKAAAAKPKAAAK